MKSLSVKLGVILSVVGLFIIGYLAKGYFELRTQNEELRKKLNELKSEIETQSKQITKETLESLKKVEARLQVGIPYQEYTKLLGESLYQVNLFLESPESKQRPELTQSIKKVLSHHLMSKTIWGYKIEAGINLYPREDDPFWQNIILLYPQAKWNDFQYTMQLIWTEASEELKKATNLLPQE